MPDALHPLIAHLDHLSENGRYDMDGVVRWLAEASRALPEIGAPEPMQHKPYTRSLLHRTGDYELLVMHWHDGAPTALHDHGGKNCWFVVMDGSMRVENFRRLDDGAMPGYARLERAGEMLLGPGETDYRGDDAAHRCIASGRTTTLHLYAQPLQTFNVFDEARETCTAVTPRYDADLSLYFGI